VAKVTCLRKRYGPESSSRPVKGRPTVIGHSNVIHIGGNGVARTPSCGERKEKRVSRSIKDLGQGTRFGLASRADPPHETDESQEY